MSETGGDEPKPEETPAAEGEAPADGESAAAEGGGDEAAAVTGAEEEGAAAAAAEAEAEAAGEGSGEPEIGVTTYEIKQFRTSISARRFPALRELRDDDIAALIIADKVAKQGRPWTKSGQRRKVNPSHPVDPVKEAKKPEKAEIGLQYMTEAGTLGRMPFSPCNPTMAKNDIFLNEDKPFALCQTEYEGARNYFLQSKQASLRYGETLHRGAFLPNAPSQAKDQIRVNYFLNSADAETLEREKSATLRRSEENKSSFVSEHATVVQHYKKTGQFLDGST